MVVAVLLEAPGPGVRLQALRERTRSAHAAVESVACMRRLFATDYTLDEYRLLLERLLGFFMPLERTFSACPAARFQLGCSRTDRLRLDLARLGASTAPAAAGGPALDGFDCSDESSRAGICYVFEGAALGGQVIRRTLSSHFGAALAGAVAYFDCYDGAHGPVWRRTIQQIEQEPGLDLERLCASAEFAFATFAVWLDAQPVRSVADLVGRPGQAFSWR